MRRTASFDVLSVKIGLTDSPVGEFKNQKKCSKFQTGGVYILPVWGSKTPGRIKPKFFLVVGVHDVITPFKLGDDRFRGFGLAEGQSLPFPIYFELLKVVQHSHYRVRCDMEINTKFTIWHAVLLSVMWLNSNCI